MNHSFDIEVATELGMEAAVLLQNITFWCQKNKANNKNEHDGLYWTYNSARAFAEQFPYISPAKIRSALNRLEREGYIRTGNFNKNAYDRTKWYAATEKAFMILKIPFSETTNTFENFTNGNTETHEPIPDINTDVITDTDTDNKAKRFSKPSIEEVRERCTEKGYPDVSLSFWNYYESKGWVVGRSPMKNWHAALSGWVSRDRKRPRVEQAKKLDAWQQQTQNELRAAGLL